MVFPFQLEGSTDRRTGFAGASWGSCSEILYLRLEPARRALCYAFEDVLFVTNDVVGYDFAVGICGRDRVYDVGHISGMLPICLFGPGFDLDSAGFTADRAWSAEVGGIEGLGRACCDAGALVEDWVGTGAAFAGAGFAVFVGIEETHLRSSV